MPAGEYSISDVNGTKHSALVVVAPFADAINPFKTIPRDEPFDSALYSRYGLSVIAHAIDGYEGVGYPFRDNPDVGQMASVTVKSSSNRTLDSDPRALVTKSADHLY